MTAARHASACALACLVALGALALLLRPAAGASARRQAAPRARPQPSPAPSPSPASPRTRPPILNEQERRGKAIYLRGESPAGREIVAVSGEIEMPGSTLPCAGCHGLRGEGKTEGGVTAGALAWPHLTKPDGHTHPTGREHGPFDESSFARAVVGGTDPADNPLLEAMPRYRMSPADMADLVSYLKRIGDERAPE